MVLTTGQNRHTERRDFLLRLLASLRVSPDDREDLAQLALLRFLSRGYAEKALDSKREKALLAKIGYSIFVDSCRKKRSHNLGVGEAEIVDHHQNAIKESVNADVQDLVESANLDPDDRLLLEKRFGDGESLVAIARDWGLHVNTIRRRLERILEQLRRLAMTQENSTTNWGAGS